MALHVVPASGSAGLLDAGSTLTRLKLDNKVDLKTGSVIQSIPVELPARQPNDPPDSDAIHQSRPHTASEWSMRPSRIMAGI